MRVVMLDGASLGDDLQWQSLQAVCGDWQCHAYSTPAEVADRIATAQIVITNKVVLDADLLARAPDLRLIVVAATGVNNIDLDVARRAGIRVCNAVGYSTASVVQHTWMLILALAGRLSAYQRAVAQGGWSQSPVFCHLGPSIQELAGKTLGIVGWGRIGQGVAQVASAFGMRVLVAQSFRTEGVDEVMERVPLEQLLSQVDVLSLHCPLSARTRHLIDAQALRLLKPGALLINTGRGGLVDEMALVEALRAGRLGGAATDVLEQEPPAEGHPLLALNDEINLVVTPHVAWASQASRQRLVEQMAQVIQAFRSGVALNVVV